MTSARIIRGFLVASVAISVAGAAAMANLRLIESHHRPVEPLSLPHAGSPSPPNTPTDPGGGPTSTTTTLTPPSTAVGPTAPVPPTGPTSAPPTTAAGGSTTTHAVGNAATVTLSTRSGTLKLVSVRLTSGWTYDVEKQSGDEVELKFRRGADGAEASFHARLDGEALRVEVDDDGIDGPDD